METRWTPQQQKAISRDGRNILVSAAAGSGKTAVLVERIFQKIAGENGTDIDKLVVVTFTKAAAAEMKQRIRDAIDARLETEPDNIRLQKQLTLVQNAQITTIDSFCLNIIRNYFTEIDLDPGFRTADEGEMKLLEHDVMEEMLEDYYSEDREEFTKFVEGYGTGKNDEKIEEIILKLYHFARSYPWPEEWYDSCVQMYDIADEDAFEKNTAMRYLTDYVARRLTDFDKEYTILEEICSQADGPQMYLAAIQSDHMGMHMIQNAANFAEMSRLVQLLSFDALGRKKLNEVSEDKKAYVKACRDNYKDFVNKTLKTKIFSKDVEEILRDIHQNKAAVAVMVELARDFTARMQKEKKERNIIDFNDMEHMALNILVHRENGKSSYTEVADILSAFYEEILIDEYQDSNMLQEEILTAVSKGKYDAAKNNIYMVGDVKQSIYRFRMAAPELFMEKYNSYTPEESAAEKIELQKNFRSRKNVLDTVNDVFAGAMNEEYTGITYDEKAQLNVGFDYEQLETSEVKEAGITFGTEEERATEVLFVMSQKDVTDEEFAADEEKEQDASEKVRGTITPAQSPKELQAMAIAHKIKKLMQGKDGKPYLVYDKKSPLGYRKIRYSDIVILLRTVTGWADTFVDVLMNQDIPAYSDASTGYFNVREIKLLLSYLTVIDNPLQDIPMAAVLLSYFGRLDTQELAMLRMCNRRKNLWETIQYIYELKNKNTKQELADNKSDESNIDNIIQNADTESEHTDNPQEKAEYDDTQVEQVLANEELCRKLNQLVEKLTFYRDKAEILSIYNLIWEVVYQTGYYDYVGTMPAGATRQANVDLLLERASAYEKTSYSGLFNFLRYIERMQKFDVDFAEATLLGENENLVRVMSIHKSKGLEFPVVFVAGMDKKINLSDAGGDVIIDKDLGIGTNAIYMDKRIKTPTCIKAAVGARIAQESISEELRVLYVAMTRAREKLIMVGCIPEKSEEKQRQNWQDKSVHIQTTGTLTYSDIATCGTYADMVMPIVLNDNQAGKAYSNTGVFAYETVPERTLYEQMQNQQDVDLTESEEAECEVEADTVDSIQMPYPYEQEAQTKTKVTVSELKKQQADQDFLEESTYSEDYLAARQAEDADEQADSAADVEEIVPKFLREGEETLPANERGTAYHRVMECLNYESDVDAAMMKQEIAQMLQDEKLTQSQYDCIEAEKILAFVQSPIGKRVQAAKQRNQLWREQPFVFTDADSADDLLIQGVIDLYLEEAEEIVIVDYKTDRVKKGKAGEKELIRRYQIQLSYYAKAIEQITGKRVKEKIIYSFTLGKEIPV